MVKQFNETEIEVEAILEESFYRTLFQKNKKYRTKTRIVFDSDFKIKIFDFIEKPIDLSMVSANPNEV